MKPIKVPESYNYVGIFLMLSCNLSCSYCINHLTGKAKRRKPLNGEEWVSALNRLELREDLPITLQGGEPSIHPHFTRIISGLKHEVDILTNLQFDPEKFIKEVPATRLRREAPYASIRVSYHPETMDFETTLRKAKILHENGYSIGLYGVLHPKYRDEIYRAQMVAKDQGLDFRTKEFLGNYDGVTYGNYRYHGSVGAEKLRTCECKTSELLIAPDGDVYRCHHDLYNEIESVGSILDDEFRIQDVFRKCSFYGNCNPCDVKIKTNRYQIMGHTSVEIRPLQLI